MARLPTPPDRTLTAIIGLLACHIAVVALSFGLIELERQRVAVDGARLSSLRSDAASLEAAIYQQELALHDYASSGAPAALAAYQSAVGSADALLEGMASDSTVPEAVRTSAAAIDRAAAAWRREVADPALAAVRAAGDAAQGAGTVPQRAPAGPSDRADVVHVALVALDRELSRVALGLLAHQDELAFFRVLATASGVGALLLAAAFGILMVRRNARIVQRNAVRDAVLGGAVGVTSTAPDDTAIAASNLESLALMVRPDASVIHVVNRSRDRAVPEAMTGRSIADAMTPATLSRCPCVGGGALVVTNDLTRPAGGACRAYPAQHGTLACVPLNGGGWVGTIHLYWEQPNALPPQSLAGIAHVADRTALAIANHRLEVLLRDESETDEETGLPNRSTFDRAVTDALAARGIDRTVALLVLAIDAFDDLVDQFGEDAGIEALRAFAGVLQSCMRTGDIAARLHGEEFAILLPGVDGTGAGAIAERVRGRTEATIVPLSPGVTARIAVSTGIAVAPDQGTDRSPLMRAAEQALRDSRARAAARGHASQPERTLLARAKSARL